MKKLIVEIDETLHRNIKMIAFSQGLTMRDLVIRWLEEMMKENLEDHNK